jgi:hypothetical protein
MPPTTAHRTDRVVTYNLLLCFFYRNTLNFCILLLTYSNDQSTHLLERTSDFRKKLMISIFDRVMKSTNVSLCAFIVPQAEKRCIFWTRYINLFTWFNNFKVFLIEFVFANDGCNGEPVFDEKTMHQILHIDATDISVKESYMIVGGRPEVSFHDPHLPMPSLTSAK